MAIELPIYMDYNATTPVDPRVLQSMLPYFSETFGNAASRNHSFGWTASNAVQVARETLATFVGGTSPKEIIFTSGATEADNLALKGVAEYYRSKGNHIVTTTIEHKAILDTAKHLQSQGFDVTYVPVGADGLVDPDDIRKAITPKTILVSVMLANNEVGTIQPIEQIGAITRERDVLFHTDAVQGLGKIPFNAARANVDLISMSAHKIYGPKGVGALWVRQSKPRIRLVAQMDGGGHERGMRSGTLNVPAIVGLGKAAEICMREMDEESVRCAGFRDRLRDIIRNGLEQVTVNGSTQHCLPGTLNMSFSFVEGEALMMAIKDVAVSSGSACTSASLEPSYVLRAMGVGDELAHSSIRFGIGRFTTQEQVDYVGQLVVEKVQKLREMSPLYEMFKEGIDLQSVQWSGH